jgi:hypothetical protein
MFNEQKEVQPKVVNTTFTTRDEVLRGRIMQLGHAFTQAVAEGDQELAKAIQREALFLKEGVNEDEKKDING